MFKCSGCGDSYTSEYYVKQHKQLNCKHTLTLQRWREGHIIIPPEPKMVNFPSIVRERISFKLDHITLEYVDTILYNFVNAKNNQYTCAYEVSMALIKQIFENEQNRCVKRNNKRDTTTNVFRDYKWEVFPDSNIYDRLMMELSHTLLVLLKKYTLYLRHCKEEFLDSFLVFIDAMNNYGYVSEEKNLTRTEKQLIKRFYKQAIHDIKHHLLTLQ
jgi:hypothetical protein